MDGCVHLRVATCISASNRSYKQRVQRGLLVLLLGHWVYVLLLVLPRGTTLGLIV